MFQVKGSLSYNYYRILLHSVLTMLYEKVDLKMRDKKQCIHLYTHAHTCNITSDNTHTKKTENSKSGWYHYWCIENSNLVWQGMVSWFLCWKKSISWGNNINIKNVAIENKEPGSNNSCIKKYEKFYHLLSKKLVQLPHSIIVLIIYIISQFNILQALFKVKFLQIIQEN